MGHIPDIHCSTESMLKFDKRIGPVFTIGMGKKFFRAKLFTSQYIGHRCLGALSIGVG